MGRNTGWISEPEEIKEPTLREKQESQKKEIALLRIRAKDAAETKISNLNQEARILINRHFDYENDLAEGYLKPANIAEANLLKLIDLQRLDRLEDIREELMNLAEDLGEDRYYSLEDVIEEWCRLDFDISVGDLDKKDMTLGLEFKRDDRIVYTIKAPVRLDIYDAGPFEMSRSTYRQIDQEITKRYRIERDRKLREEAGLNS